MRVSYGSVHPRPSNFVCHTLAQLALLQNILYAIDKWTIAYNTFITAKFGCKVPGTVQTTAECTNKKNTTSTINEVDSTSEPSVNGGLDDDTLDIITYVILVAAVCLSLLFAFALTMTVLYSKFSQQREVE